MEVYKNALKKVSLSGPTIFALLINQAIKIASEANVDQSNQQYFILLILTNGQINDMQSTVASVIKGSKVPLSIVIIGIGQENFENMHILDADENPLIDEDGVKMDRDIVQFVPFRNFAGSSRALNKEVLAEIPREIVNYFKKASIIPNGFSGVEMMSCLGKDKNEEYPEILTEVSEKSKVQRGGNSCMYSAISQKNKSK